MSFCSLSASCCGTPYDVHLLSVVDICAGLSAESHRCGDVTAGNPFLKRRVTCCMSSRGANAQGDGGFCDTSYKRELEQDSTAGWRGCQKTPGCCFAHATQQCRACQVGMCIQCLHVQRSLSERASRGRESESETTRERERERRWKVKETYCRRVTWLL